MTSSNVNSEDGDGNPYQTPQSFSAPIRPAPIAIAPEERSRARRRLFFVGAAWSIVFACPIAGMLALVFRFPVPFAGYVSGIDYVLPAFLSVVIYGIFLGGFPVLAILGGIGGAMVGRLNQPPRELYRTVILVSFLIAFVCMFLLSILDWFIGPW